MGLNPFVIGSGLILLIIVTAGSGQKQSRKCGEILTGSSGSINYKYKKAYGINERCVWTIRAPGYAELEFKLQDDGFETEFDRIHISSFKRIAGSPLVQNKTITHGQSDPVTLSGNVAIVIFYSYYTNDDREGTGFILNYKGIGQGLLQEISTSSVDFISDGIAHTGSFDHPRRKDSYSNNELSTFVVGPPGWNVAGSPPSLGADIKFENGFETCGDFCCDSVVLYESTNFQLFQRDEYCPVFNATTGHYEGGEIFVYIFTSDDTNVFSGFGVEYQWHFS